MTTTLSPETAVVAPPPMLLYDRLRHARGGGGGVLAVARRLAGSGGLEVARALAERRDMPVDLMPIAGSAPPEAAATAIDREARDRDAAMIVLETGTADGDSKSGVATALALLRMTDVPLLTVARGGSRLPRRALVVAGDGIATGWMTHLALGTLERPGALFIAHIRESLSRDGSAVAPGRRFRAARDAVARLRRIESGLDLPRGMAFDRTIREGDPVRVALRLARDWRADLIAKLVPGRSIPERVLLGRTAARLIQRGDCAVLSVPMAAVPAAAA
ncbi:MAG: universal stress protein [Gemmatimonadota bacterium]